MGDAADTIYCLLPDMILYDIIEKFKWLYGSVESLDTLMQEFYRIIQGKNQRVQAFVLYLEQTLKSIKQQHPYAMTEEEGENYLQDQLFKRLRHNIHNALHYMYENLITNTANQ